MHMISLFQVRTRVRVRVGVGVRVRVRAHELAPSRRVPTPRRPSARRARLVPVHCQCTCTRTCTRMHTHMHGRPSPERLPPAGHLPPFPAGHLPPSPAGHLPSREAREARRRPAPVHHPVDVLADGAGRGDDGRGVGRLGEAEDAQGRQAHLARVLLPAALRPRSARRGRRRGGGDGQRELRGGAVDVHVLGRRLLARPVHPRTQGAHRTRTARAVHVHRTCIARAPSPCHCMCCMSHVACACACA